MPIIQQTDKYVGKFPNGDFLVVESKAGRSTCLRQTRVIDATLWDAWHRYEASKWVAVAGEGCVLAAFRIVAEEIAV